MGLRRNRNEDAATAQRPLQWVECVLLLAMAWLLRPPPPPYVRLDESAPARLRLAGAALRPNLVPLPECPRRNCHPELRLRTPPFAPPIPSGGAVVGMCILFCVMQLIHDVKNRVCLILMRTPRATSLAAWQRDALLPVTSGDFVGNGGHGEAANADFYDGVPEILNDDVKELAELAERLPRERGAPVAGARGGLLLWPVDQRVHLIFPRFELQRLRSVAHAIERERSGKPLYRVREAANCARRGERVATEDPFQLGQALCSLGDALRDDLHKELLVPGRLHQCIGKTNKAVSSSAFLLPLSLGAAAPAAGAGVAVAAPAPGASAPGAFGPSSDTGPIASTKLRFMATPGAPASAAHEAALAPAAGAGGVAAPLARLAACRTAATTSPSTRPRARRNLSSLAVQGSSGAPAARSCCASRAQRARRRPSAGPGSSGGKIAWCPSVQNSSGTSTNAERKFPPPARRRERGGEGTRAGAAS
eukprot:CAMPEP_0118852360 /NCGR_PEP_ID=MMETSP1163-20130328/1404_1 /TAXON_ID=124430 /ORGANISM="Phaeomonas parva, Strain CCMP2877" /LENGTH=477 /DNA_ID=CAMNT_0006784783 /DNA_START=1681 /DNA_END=3114 /DNA_ORIENTATION=+